MSEMSNEFEEFRQLLLQEVELPPWDDKPVNELIQRWFITGKFASFMRVEHGDMAEHVRPNTPGTVYWIGSVPPLNAEAWDLFYDTSED